MNEIERKFYDAFSECLNNKKICINNVLYDFAKYDFGYQLDSKESSKVIIFDFKAHPEEDWFSGYIPDFAVYMFSSASGFVVEIDGHEWHEKTKEQAKADKEKDRAYLKKVLFL